LFGLAVDGLQPKIILVVDVSQGADTVVGRAGMRTMSDLRVTVPLVLLAFAAT
jgi:NitT/TauT family transport system substrate-binding protein